MLLTNCVMSGLTLERNFCETNKQIRRRCELSTSKHCGVVFKATAKTRSAPHNKNVEYTQITMVVGLYIQYFQKVWPHIFPSPPDNSCRVLSGIVATRGPAFPCRLDQHARRAENACRVLPVVLGSLWRLFPGSASQVHGNRIRGSGVYKQNPSHIPSEVVVLHIRCTYV